MFQLVIMRGREGEKAFSVAITFHKRQFSSIMLNYLSRWPGVDSCTVWRTVLTVTLDPLLATSKNVKDERFFWV